MAIEDSPDALSADIAAVGRLTAVPHLLDVLCRQTGMGFAAVARVTSETWTACAVLDKIGFGLQVGGQLPLGTTLCSESRQAVRPVVIDDASIDPMYRDHHTPRIYSIRSYVSVPIVLTGDVYFGNLCAIDPNPAQVANPATLATFTGFAELIARQLDSERLLSSAQAELLDARSATELREQFIAVLGHDLRNPLAAVSSLGHLLAMGSPRTDAAAVGRRIVVSATRMSELIDNVLDFTRARLGSGIGVHLAEQADLNSALMDVVAEARHAHPACEVVADIAIDTVVVCDGARLQQLLSNLLSNAAHHGAPQQPVKVSAGIHQGALVISVANQGRPIPPESLERIFEPFWRPADSRPGGGLGLGLHICKQIVMAHGGSLTASSSATAGTRFVASIPVRPADVVPA